MNDAPKSQDVNQAGALLCRDDGRCQYAIDHGAEGLGHCSPKCVMPRDSSAALRGEPEAAVQGSLSSDDVAYPRDMFEELIYRCSPYAFYLFQWVPYQTDARRWRLKMLHDVRAFDGREAFGIWPNGSHCGPFHDDEVEFIRISRKQHCGEWIDPRKVPEPPQAASGCSHTARSDDQIKVDDQEPTAGSSHG